MLKLILILVLLVIGFAMVWFRLVPSNPDDWHVDPVTASNPGQSGALTDIRFAASAEQVMAAFHQVASNAPRTNLVAGAPDSGFATYVTRTWFWGFPDYVSVRAIPVETGGTQLAVLSRLRFGRSDLGVNKRRTEDWLAQVEKALSP